jgi:signal transduction histidine kinase
MKGIRIFSFLVPHRIAWQVGLVFGVLVFFSLGFLGFSLISTSRQAVGNSVLRDYEDIARRAAQELTAAINRPKELLNNAAALLANIPAPETELLKAAVYQVFTDNTAQLERLALVNPAGQELVASDWNQPLKDRSTEPLFQTASASGQPDYSGVYFSDEHVPYFSIIVPIKKLNAVSGFLLAQVKLSGLWDMVDSIKLKDGEAFIVDQAGYVLVHKEERRVYQGENLAHTKPVQAVLTGNQGSLEDTAQKLLCAYAPIKPFNWGLIVRQPLSAAYAFSDRMQNTALVTILTAILIAIALSLLLARWIVRPIRQLVQSTEQVAAGNLDTRIDNRRRDEVGKLLDSFNQMVGKLRDARRLERLSNIGLATSKIGHELRNPLVAVKAFIQLLPRKHQDPAFISRFNQLVPSELARLEKMMQELSDFSAAPRLRLADCRPDELVNSALSLFDEQLKNSKINTVANLTLNGTLITADGDRIRQVIINLINNAVESMPSGGELRLSTRHDAAGKTVSIQIQDTGCGIAPDELVAVFEPFHTSKHNGLGLGLTISKEIIEQHHGSIEVISQLGQGSAVSIKLPVRSS